MEKQYFKVGDLVTCAMYGKGEVVNVNKKGTIRVLFVHGNFQHYSFEGKLGYETKRTLHQGHIDIPEPELKEIVNFEKGEYVWVRFTKNGIWHCGIFSHEKSGKYYTFIDQNKEGLTEPWDEIRKYEDRPF